MLLLLLALLQSTNYSYIFSVNTHFSYLILNHFIFRAYWGFADHFKDQADMLLNSLEHNHRRMLQSSGTSGNMSNSSSSNSLNMTGRNSGPGMSSGNVVGAPGHATSSTNVFSARSRQSSVTSSKGNISH